MDVFHDSPQKDVYCFILQYGLHQIPSLFLFTLQGVDIKNFSGSFANGLAFCALIHKFHPDKFDFDLLDAENREHNVTLAIEIGT